MVSIHHKVEGANGKNVGFEVRLEFIFQLQHLWAVSHWGPGPKNYGLDNVHKIPPALLDIGARLFIIGVPNYIILSIAMMETLGA